MEKPRFISLEGGEGVGKSSLAAGIVHFLQQNNIQVVKTREPGGTPIADEIRQLFKAPPPHDEMESITEALLVSAARAQHVLKVIKPALAAGQWVVSDRYADSTRVYQGALGGVPFSELEWLIDFSTAGVVPDLTFLLDCDVELTMNRIKQHAMDRAAGPQRDEAARFDGATAQVHDRIRQGFRKLAGFYPGRFYILDASRSPEHVLKDACDELEKRWMI